MRATILVFLALQTATLSASQLFERKLPPAACGRELEQVDREVHGGLGLAGDRLNELLHRALTHFRFDRQKTAVDKLDALLESLGGRLGAELPAGDREEIKTAIEKLWTCVSSTRRPAMATLTVRTFQLDPSQKDGRGAPAGAGVYVKVEDMHVGRTGADGTLTLQVPSGRIAVDATEPSTTWGSAEIDLEPGTSGTVSIVLDDGKEAAELTDVELVEAVDGVVGRSSGSFTIRFVHEGAVVPITKIDHIWLVNENFNSGPSLEHLFRVTGNTMAATNVDVVFRALDKAVQEEFRHRPRPEEIWLEVQAYDERSEFTHVNMLRFRIAAR